MVTKHREKRFMNTPAKITTTLLLAGSLLIAAGCGNEESGSSSGRSGMRDGSRRKTAAIPVQVARVKRGDISRFLLHTTTIEAEKVVEVVAKVSGQVSKLPVEEGMKVKRGTLLAQLDEAELKLELIQARARMETDKAAFERAQSMFEKNLIAHEAFDATRLQYENSKAQYEAARLRVEYTAVRSPIAGIVTARNVELGQRVAVNQVLFVVADFDPLRARIYVPEKDITEIYEGQKAIIRADALPEQEFTATVRMISPVVDPANGTVKVTLDVPSARGKLKPGMFVSVYITTATHKDALLIPKKALLIESENDQVYVFDQGKARKAVLETGFTSGDMIEVLSGLSEGDLVVTIGQEGLRPGLPIRISGGDVPAVSESADSSGTQAVASTNGKPETGRKPAAQKPAAAVDGKTAMKAAAPAAAQTVDTEVVRKLEEWFMKNQRMRQRYEAALEEDPAMKDDPARKLDYFRSSMDRMMGFMMRNERSQKAFEKALEKDPDLETDLLKQMAFIQGLFRDMRRGR